MTTEQFISASIDRGEKEGCAALGTKEKTIFLISEAEVLCDMQGIDTLLDRIENRTIPVVSEAFDAIGAIDIATCLKEIETMLPQRNDAILERANQLITSRHGYSYDSIKQYAERA